jgi:hypothetical protein
VRSVDLWANVSTPPASGRRRHVYR